MKIIANFWLITEDDEIAIPFTMDNLSAPPFKVGDKISIQIDDIYPKQYDKYPAASQHSFKESNEDARKKYHFKDVEIVKVAHYARCSVLSSGTMTYEYHCKYANEEEKNT